MFGRMCHGSHRGLRGSSGWGSGKEKPWGAQTRLLQVSGLHVWFCLAGLRLFPTCYDFAIDVQLAHEMVELSLVSFSHLQKPQGGASQGGQCWFMFFLLQGGHNDINLLKPLFFSAYLFIFYWDRERERRRRRDEGKKGWREGGRQRYLLPVVSLPWSNQGHPDHP